MGTHPIFESDFDCLTDGAETENEKCKCFILEKYFKKRTCCQDPKSKRGKISSRALAISSVHFCYLWFCNFRDRYENSSLRTFVTIFYVPILFACPVILQLYVLHFHFFKLNL